MNVHAKTGTAEGAKLTVESGLKYMTGFGNSFETEALPDALPVGRNSPQMPQAGAWIGAKQPGTRPQQW